MKNLLLWLVVYYACLLATCILAGFILCIFSQNWNCIFYFLVDNSKKAFFGYAVCCLFAAVPAKIITNRITKFKN